jgi:hypothetical protein
MGEMTQRAKLQLSGRGEIKQKSNLETTIHVFHYKLQAQCHAIQYTPVRDKVHLENNKKKQEGTSENGRKGRLEAIQSGTEIRGQYCNKRMK